MRIFARWFGRLLIGAGLTVLIYIGLYAAALLAFTNWLWGQQDKIQMAQMGMVALAGLISWFVLRRQPKERRINFHPSRIPQNGHDFEVWVAKMLRKDGWKTEVTQGSGDQGVDVIASRGRIRMGIQCKRYKGSVGNKAVQEIYAGVAYYRLTHAAVVTNSYYTESAKNLAKRTGVYLLRCEDLVGLSKKIKR